MLGTLIAMIPLTKAQAAVHIQRVHGVKLTLHRDPYAKSNARCQAWFPQPGKTPAFVPVALARTWEGVLAQLRKQELIPEPNGIE